MTLRALIGCILFGTCALGISLVSNWWSRQDSLTQIRLELGHRSLLVSGLEDLRRQSRTTAQLLDLAYSQEVTHGVESNSTYLLTLALAHLGELKAHTTTCQNLASQINIRPLCQEFSDSLDSLATLINKGSKGGITQILIKGLDDHILRIQEQADKLVENVKTSAADLLASVNKEQDSITLFGWLASLGYIGLVFGAWRWVSNGALIPLQTLTQRANKATVDGVPLQMKPTGPTEIKELIQSVGQLVGHLDEAKKLLSARVISNSATITKVQRELQNTEEQLIQAQKLDAVGCLAGGIAHDFNNILTIILGCGDLLCESHSENSSTGELARDICESAEKASSLTRKLMMFAGDQDTVREALDLNEVIASMTTIMDRVLGDSIEIHIERHPDPCFVELDRAHIESVIVNLVVNAREAMQDGGTIFCRTSTISSDSGTASNDTCVFTVRDSGTGMDEETKQRIFEPFFSTKSRQSGSGLGLATAYGIISRAGGHISVESTPGNGSTFELHLPLCDPPTKEYTPSKASKSHRSSEGDETILYVEDNESQRNMFSRALRTQGYTVEEAADGDEGLALLMDLKGNLDMLVTDYQLPGPDGTKLIEWVSKNYPAIPVLCVTGSIDLNSSYITAHNSRTAAAMAAGQGDRASLLRKPFTPSALAAKIREMLDAMSASK
jgi:signal transduction histidine kinase/CheY-like chemotaxis protein